ncbi:unnamed protein product [Phytophthora fragariaefolia]|uniref:Unnamed protein product n=1 Tax=Phytophthora fragariaefolia TaxID=1490495 RepID=A0A9W6X2I9_9STRA|nr:unnamed protein product [Phytophthora fragariaefolia]
MAATSLATLGARVTGFDYNGFHAYTTVVTLDGASWTLGIRYSKFLALYDKLRAAERGFKFDFPPKGGFFFSPKPEERKVRLDAFLQAALKFFAQKKRPESLARLLREYLQVDKCLQEAKRKQKKADEQEQTASDESASEEPVEEPQPDKKEAPKLSDKAQEGKKALVNAAFGAAVVSAIKDNAMDAKKAPVVEKEEAKKEEAKVEVKKEIKIEAKKEEAKVEAKKEEAKVEAKKEDVKVEAKKEDVKVEAKKEIKVEAKKEDVKVEAKKEEAKAETKVEEKKQEVKVEEVKVEEIKPSTTTTTTTTTTSGGSTVVETNVTSQPTANKTVVGKTVTITSKPENSHSFKVEMTEKKASVVTLTAAAKQMADVAEQKPKKKRSNRKKSISKAPVSTASTSSDGFESPDGVDDVARVDDNQRLSESQKKARNQRRKEKRKKNQKKVRAKDLKA